MISTERAPCPAIAPSDSALASGELHEVSRRAVAESPNESTAIAESRKGLGRSWNGERGRWPKDIREPRGPDHMAKMKAARGPYSDPRDTYIARTIRYAFVSSRGNPLSTGQLVKEIYGWQLRVERKPLRSWHYQNVRRALRKVATPIGRASTICVVEAG